MLDSVSSTDSQEPNNLAEAGKQEGPGGIRDLVKKEAHPDQNEEDLIGLNGMITEEKGSEHNHSGSESSYSEDSSQTGGSHYHHTSSFNGTTTVGKSNDNTSYNDGYSQPHSAPHHPGQGLTNLQSFTGFSRPQMSQYAGHGQAFPSPFHDAASQFFMHGALQGVENARHTLRPLMGQGHASEANRRSPTNHNHPKSGSINPSYSRGEDGGRKREIRLIKNREAARECRRKKKEYIKCLENRVAVLENQNKALIEELKTLKELYFGKCHKMKS